MNQETGVNTYLFLLSSLVYWCFINHKSPVIITQKHFRPLSCNRGHNAASIDNNLSATTYRREMSHITCCPPGLICPCQTTLSCKKKLVLKMFKWENNETVIVVHHHMMGCFFFYKTNILSLFFLFNWLCGYTLSTLDCGSFKCQVRLWVFSITFNNILINIMTVSSIRMVERNQSITPTPATSHGYTLSHKTVSSLPRHEEELN